VRDNQEFVSDYIQEVKPYHVQVREFNLKYTGFDISQGDLTDFDVPAYYDTTLEIPKYISPVLLPYEHGTAFNSSINAASDASAASTIWNTWPYSQWYNNHWLSIDSTLMVSQGSGYSTPPTVIFGTEWTASTTVTAGQQIFFVDNLYTVTTSGVTGTIAPLFSTGSQADGTAALSYAGVTATGTAVINSLGQVVAVTIDQAGSGYRAAPAITIAGGNGTGAEYYAVVSGQGSGQVYNAATVPTAIESYTLARSFRTVIRYDRFQYFSDVRDWNTNGTYQDGDLVRYDDRVWQAASSTSTAVVGPTFNLEDLTLVNAATFN
jgi:hypothetical protein